MNHILHKGESMNLEKMVTLATKCRENAYAPYSNFKVGVCLSTPDGQLFLGCNVENSAYPSGQCAEATAIGNLISSGSTDIAHIVIVTDADQPAWSCGNCRQKLSEFVTDNAQVHSLTLSGQHEECAFADLLPKQFGKTVLLQDE